MLPVAAMLHAMMRPVLMYTLATMCVVIMTLLNAATDFYTLLTCTTRLSHKELQSMSKQQLATRLRDFTQQFSTNFLD
jgi:hypothetical protein